MMSRYQAPSPSIFVVIFILMLVFPAHAETIDKFGLTGIDQNTINRGELVHKEKKIKDAPWPEITVFGIINATAMESVSVFYSYHEHKEFLPGLLSSVPVKYICPTEIHLKFEMKIPWPLKNSKHISGNKFGLYGEGGYKIEWYHVTSTSSKNSYGGVTFLPYNKKTLFIYRSFVHPKSSFAGFFKKRALKEVLRSARAIISRVESVKKHNKEKIIKYINALQSTLRGEYIYKDIPVADK